MALALEKGKEKEKEKDKEKEVVGSVPSGAIEPQITRVQSGVHPGPVSGVSIVSLVVGKRPFRNEKEAFEIYSPLVPSLEFEHFALLSGGELMRKICHMGAQVFDIPLICKNIPFRVYLVISLVVFAF